MTKTGRKILLAVICLIVVIAMIGITFEFRRQLGWWAFIDCFTLFMTCFSWLMSLLIARIIPHSGKILQNIAIIFAALTLVAFIVEYFLSL